MTSEYEPIDCDQHSVLEVLALRRVQVRVEALDEPGNAIRITGRVIVVLTRDKAEFLRLETADGVRDLRLDRLVTILDAAGRPQWRQKPGEHD